MTTTGKGFSATVAQIAWVVSDIRVSQRFLGEAMGIQHFSEPEIIRLKDFDSTYYGQPCDGESLVSMAYSGGTFIELIQPLSGRSIFQDYIDQNPAGGLHHIAYSLPIADLDQLISTMTAQGLPIVTRVNHPIASIVFFDTSKELGVFTEIMGITEAGEKAVQQMKSRG